MEVLQLLFILEEAVYLISERQQGSSSSAAPTRFLKGASIDDATFARHLDRMKQQLNLSSPGILEWLRKAAARSESDEFADKIDPLSIH